MKALLVAVNAKYAHTNPAVRSIAAFARQRGAQNIEIAEYTVNQRAEDILIRLYESDADVYLFSCYIWNIALIRRVAGDLRKIAPDRLILAGGPETGCHSADFLEGNPAFDGVLAGEGELAVTGLLRRLQEGGDWRGTPGLVTVTGGHNLENPSPPLLAMDDLPFAYGDLPRLGDRALYYESMRGCPFSCSYCLSSLRPGVRLRSLGLVQEDLTVFLKAGVRRVKFTDRTFNCDRERAMAIWRFLMERDNGVTNFHFELSGDLLDDRSLALLDKARPGLFQFEIGVQSCHPATLREIHRPEDQARLFEMTGRLREKGSIHLHLDLIAGLPYEDLPSFVRSFHAVYALRPHQLQMGFLKVLKGSEMERNASRYSLVWREEPPYEVLSTAWMDFGDLTRLKAVERALELYYNSGRFAHIVRWLEKRFPSPWDFYLALGGLMGELPAPPGKMEGYELLGRLMTRRGMEADGEAQWICKYDLALHESPGKLPAWVQTDGVAPYKAQIRRFYADSALTGRYLPGYDCPPRQMERLTYLEVFPFHPGTGEAGPVPVLIDYRRRDLLGRAQAITLPPECLGL